MGEENDPEGGKETKGKPDDEGEEFDEDRARAKIKKANQEAAGLRERLKEAEKAATKLKELEDADKSELQKLTDKVAEMERKAADAEARALRLEIASDKGLTSSQARRLVGSSREELEKDADELLADFKGGGAGDEEGKDPKETRGRPASGKPQENLKGGGAPSEEVSETDPAKLAAAVPRY